MSRRILIPILGLTFAHAGCGGARSTSSGYRPPPRQLPVLPDSISPKGCSDSTMGGTLLAVCDPILLEKAWQNHTLTQPGTLHVAIAGRKVRVGSTSGLTQVIADDGIGSLLVPAKVTLTGTASDGSYLYISARSHKPKHVAWGEALFRHLGLAHGGTTTIDVKLDDGVVVFAVRRPDSSVLASLRRSHFEGPGPHLPLPTLPRHYADTPEQGVRTYVAAINARDGKTICELWSAKLRARFTNDETPCWAAATGFIDYGSESDSPVFRRLELLEVGSGSTRTSHGIAYTAVAVRLRKHQLQQRYSTRSEARDLRTLIWFRRTTSGWRIAAEPFFGASEPGAPS